MSVDYPASGDENPINILIKGNKFTQLSVRYLKEKEYYICIIFNILSKAKALKQCCMHTLSLLHSKQGDHIIKLVLIAEFLRLLQRITLKHYKEAIFIF